MAKKPVLEVLMLPVADLRPHPLLSMTGMMDALIVREQKKGRASGKEREKHKENAEILEKRYAAMRADIAEQGIIDSIKVCKSDAMGGGWHIADGRHRWMCAREAGMEEVPCMVVSESDARAIVHSALLGKPMSAGAIAYTAVKIYPEICDNENGGDRKSDSFLNVEITQAGLADKVGVAAGSISKAVEVYRMLHNTRRLWPDGDHAGAPMYVPGAKAKFEDAIFVPNIGLGGVKSGIVQFRDSLEVTPSDDASETADEKRKRLEREKKQAFNTAYGRTERAHKHLSSMWPKYDEEMKRKISHASVQGFLSLPEDYQTAFLEGYEKMKGGE